MLFKTIEWKNNQVVMLDQRLLPTQEVYHTYSTYSQVGQAIKDMVIRGAPAIGVAACMGVALGAQSIQPKSYDDFFNEIQKICDDLFQTRPTAVNLAWGLEQMKVYLNQNSQNSICELKQGLIDKAQAIREEDILLNERIGKNGAELFSSGDCILTHCNAGALATAGYGTALSVIYKAFEQGKSIQVFADETRPYLQGARLSAWELQKNQIPVTVITDNMAGWLMSQGEITKVIVGADRIAANGDVANKIGTYTVAVLAKRHQIPFYVAAPLSTIDLKTATGESIPIEERPEREVTHVQEVRLTPEGVGIRNPAFDVTPAELVSAIITDKGIVEGDYEKGLKALFGSNSSE